mmetsp:Transcript_19225/g.39213  ORF Transcript_19225/g.39213 Transcript_19225/m.39213 type:complete len:202 (+) Transcript_19225:933-1538(+)
MVISARSDVPFVSREVSMLWVWLGTLDLPTMLVRAIPARNCEIHLNGEGETEVEKSVLLSNPMHNVTHVRNRQVQRSRRPQPIDQIPSLRHFRCVGKVPPSKVCSIRHIEQSVVDWFRPTHPWHVVIGSVAPPWIIQGDLAKSKARHLEERIKHREGVMFCRVHGKSTDAPDRVIDSCGVSSIPGLEASQAREIPKTSRNI